MAISSYKTYLCTVTSASSTTTYTKLIDIKDSPNMGGAPEMLETTTKSDPMQTFIEGIQQLDALEFTANYDVDDFATLKAMAGTSTKFALILNGTEGSGGVVTGSDGVFTWTGTLSVYLVGNGVNEVNDMGITITPSTAIEFAESTTA